MGTRMSPHSGFEFLVSYPENTTFLVPSPLMGEGQGEGEKESVFSSFVVII